MSRDFTCDTCHDTGLVRSPRWWDVEDDLVTCTQRNCIAAEERRETQRAETDRAVERLVAAVRHAQQESDRSGTQCPLRSDLAGRTPSPGGASDDAGVFLNTRSAS